MRWIASIGRRSMRHPWIAIAAWLAFVVIALVSSTLTGTNSLPNGAVGESARGYALMDQHQAYTPARAYAYVHSTRLRDSDPPFRSAVRDVAAAVKRLVGGRPQFRFAPDGHSVLVVARIERYSSDGAVRAAVRAAGLAHPLVTVEQTSDFAASDARDTAIHNDLHRAELLSVPVTLVILLFAFGAVVAALVPLLLALTAVAAAFGLLGPISQVFGLDDSVKTVVLLIGMAVGVDYALFYVIRSREERQRGATPREALERTVQTSGRTVLVSGTTVAVAMAGLYVVGSDVFNGIASGTITVVACAVAGSLTVLVAVLALLGPRIDKGRIPFLPHLRTESEHSRFWPAVVDRVLRRPVLSIVLSAGLLVLLALPALRLHLDKPSNEALSGSGEPALAALADIRAEFPSTAAPALVVVAGPRSEQARAREELRRFEALVLARHIANPPFVVSGAPDKQAAVIELPLAGAGDNSSSRAAIGILRRDLIPQTFGRVPGVETAVTGDTAEDVDFTNQMKHGLPYVLAFVLGLAFVILLVAFRSLIVPIKAIVLNLLSVGASYGVLVLVFQHHWAEGILGFKSNGAIISWLPLFLFVILFGLSMDYHVFILSRIREAVDGGLPTDRAVRYGITVTAGVVTSAALVMVGVFSLFGSLSSLELKQAGVGLATAVLLDATVVRAVLLPASMTVLGEWNWYLPSWLERLPRAAIEAPASGDPV
jgi:RND superfamily putative drug exporter